MKKVVITGANRGIGLSLVQKFLNEGNEVWALCRQNSDDLKALEPSSNHCLKIQENVDVTDLDILKGVAQTIGEMDILINNAGLLIGDHLESLVFNDLQKQIEVNTFAVLKVALTLGQNIKPGGTFGILTSRMGSIADNTSGGQYGYRLSKAAANAIGKSLAEDWREKPVTVLLLHPGYVRTEMTGGRGLIDPPESAQGLYDIITTKTLQETGTFWHTNGEQLDW